MDASLNGLGAVLYQTQAGVGRGKAYASRSLKPSENNYPAHKLEFLALKWYVTGKFHDFLYGSSFEIITDNYPLTYILPTAKLDATGQRWVASPSDYNFTIKYMSGKKYADAGGLSRRQEGNWKKNIYIPPPPPPPKKKKHKKHKKNTRTLIQMLGIERSWFA